MQSTALDTLERADIPPAQARAFVEAIDIEVTAMQGTQATKLDVAVLRTDLRGEMARLSTDLRAKLLPIGVAGRVANRNGQHRSFARGCAIRGQAP